MSDNNSAVLEWINTFESIPKVDDLSDLCNGHIICLMLGEISSEHFGSLHVSSEAGNNWALISSDIKKILRALNEYYANVLHKAIDISSVDANLIDEASQTVLKRMVEQAMGKMTSLEERDSVDYAEEAGEDNVSAAELERAHVIIESLQEDKQQLNTQVTELTSKNRQLKEELERLKDEVFQKNVMKDSDQSKAAAVAAAQSSLKSEIDDLKYELQQKQQEIASMKRDYNSLQHKFEGLEQTKARLEIEALQLADEIDIAREKAAKLTKAEATIEKYQRRLEELEVLRNQNRDYEEKLDKYLEQIHELENSNKSIAHMQKLIEQHKDKKVEIERQLFEVTSAVRLKDDEVHRLKAELDSSVDARRFLEDELNAARAELETIAAERATESGGSGFGMFESPIAMKEKMKQMELELRVLKESAQKEHPEMSAEQMNTDLLLGEIEELKAAKKEREDMLVASRRQIAELQHEVQKASRALQDAERSNEATSGEHIRDIEQQLEVKKNTVAHLEELLKQCENKLSKVESDKEKLEVFAKRSLTNFKEKYMKALHQNKQEKQSLEMKVAHLMEKIEKDAENHRREERLILSSMYELGVHLIDRNIHLQIQESANTPSTFLSNQRAEQDKRLAMSTPNFEAAMYELFEVKKKQHDLKIKLNKMYLKYGDYG